MDKTFTSRLSMVNVQSVPSTPPLNKFGGYFENGWDTFFVDLGRFLTQMQSVQKFGDVCVSRNGRLVTATGSVGTDPVYIGVLPVSAFTSDGVSVSADGNISAVEGTRAFSITFIAR